VLVVGAVGGGIGYSLAGQHAAAAPTASTSTNHLPPPTGKARVAAAPGGKKIVDGAISMLATQTGQSVASIRDQLVTGKSIDAIAGAQAPAVESEIIAAITKLTDKAVKTGKISAAQESAGLATVKTRVEALMAEPGTPLVKDMDKLVQALLAQPAAGAQPAPPTSPTPTV
jgi:hypothetical protein